MVLPVKNKQNWVIEKKDVGKFTKFGLNGIYRSFSKISRAYFKFTRFLDVPIFEYFRVMLIFESCLFKKCTIFGHAYFQIFPKELGYQLSRESHFQFSKHLSITSNFQNIGRHIFEIVVSY